MKRISGLAAALALFAFLIPTWVGTAFAWNPPTITVVCPQVQDVDNGSTDFNWYVALHGVEPNYNMDWSTNGTDWNGPIDWSDQNDPLVGGGWGGPITTTSFADNGGDNLWVRWSSDHNSKAGPVFNDCKDETQSEAPSEAPSEASSEVPSTVPTPTLEVTPSPSAVPTPIVTPTTTSTPLSLTAAPKITPPPTTTGRSSNSSSTPLFALLICLAFGGLGLWAVVVQRRSIR